jgi:hypothetical protein
VISWPRLQSKESEDVVIGQPMYRGSAVHSLREQFKQHGESVEKCFLESITSEQALMYLSALPLSWVALRTAKIIFEKAAPLLYPEHPQALQCIGYDRAKNNLTGLYKFILKVSTPAFVIGQTAKIWNLYYNMGKASSLIDVRRNRAEMHVTGFPEWPRTFREITSGYIVGAVELTGAKNIRLERDDSDPEDWKWVGSWE